MLSTKVKASSLTHLTDARYFAAWEVQWLGFQMIEGADHYIPAQEVAAMKEWVDGVKICGEFGLSSVEEIMNVVDVLALDTVQVGMFTPLESLQNLKGKVEVLQELVVENYTDPADLEYIMKTNQAAVDYFVLQCSRGGVEWSDIEAGTPIDLATLEAWAQEYPILLDIHLSEGQGSAAVAEKYPIKGFAVSGGEEEKVGFKSFDELDDFFEDLEVLV